MALNFVEELPKATRGGGASRIITDEMVKELKTNPGKWAEMTESPVRSAQAYASFCKANPDFKYSTRNAGTETVTFTRGDRQGTKGEVPVVNVFMAFDPEGKLKK